MHVCLPARHHLRDASWVILLCTPFPEACYVLESGSNREGCGRTPETACITLLYLLQQVNRTHLPPSTAIRIATDKCLNIDQQAAVSTIICPALHKILFELGFLTVCVFCLCDHHYLAMKFQEGNKSISSHICESIHMGYPCDYYPWCHRLVTGHMGPNPHPIPNMFTWEPEPDRTLPTWDRTPNLRLFTK